MAHSLPRQIANRLLHLLARFLPGATSLRPWLHRRRGVQVARGVFIGDEVYLDNEHPEAITLHEGALIGLRSTLIAHTRGPGRIVVGKNAVIGAGSLIIGGGEQHSPLHPLRFPACPVFGHHHRALYTGCQLPRLPAGAAPAAPGRCAAPRQSAQAGGWRLIGGIAGRPPDHPLPNQRIFRSSWGRQVSTGGRFGNLMPLTFQGSDLSKHRL